MGQALLLPELSSFPPSLPTDTSGSLYIIGFYCAEPRAELLLSGACPVPNKLLSSVGSVRGLGDACSCNSSWPFKEREENNYLAWALHQLEAGEGPWGGGRLVVDFIVSAM